MNESTYNEHLNRLLRLAKSTSTYDFVIHHENEIIDFLTSFSDQSIHNGYRFLTRKLYFDLWMKRLKPFGRREWLVSAKFDELIHARDWYNQFFDTVERIPALAEVAGQVWLARIKSNAKSLQARIFQHKKRAYQAIDFFDQAAEELEKLPNPDFRDLANAFAHRARSAEVKAFQCLRERPGSNFQSALEEFKRATSYAKRGEVLLRKTVNKVSSQYLWYLRYWQHVAAIGLLPLRGNFTAGLKHVSLASIYASKLPSFPKQKWYVDLHDIQNQSIVIRAYEAFIAENDVPKAHKLLVEWLDQSKNIKTAGRYLRILLRKLALDVILEIKTEHGKPGKTAIELERLLTLRRSFGRADMYLRETIRAFFTTHIDYDIAIDRIKGVFILDSQPPPGFKYLDPHTDVEKSLRQLPSFFGDWLQDPGYDDEIPDEALYIFLLYVRCVAEFWVSVYRKHVSYSEMDRLIDVDLPKNF